MRERLAGHRATFRQVDVRIVYRLEALLGPAMWCQGWTTIAPGKLTRGRVQQQSEECARRDPEQQQSEQQEQQYWVSGGRTSLSRAPEMRHLQAGAAEAGPLLGMEMYPGIAGPAQDRHGWSSRLL